MLDVLVAAVDSCVCEGEVLMGPGNGTVTLYVKSFNAMVLLTAPVCSGVGAERNVSDGELADIATNTSALKDGSNIYS